MAVLTCSNPDTLESAVPDCELLVDGVLVDEEWPVGAIAQAGGEPLIAAGELEKLALWNRALRPDEVRDLNTGAEAVARREREILGPERPVTQYWKPRGLNTGVGDCMPFFDAGRFHLFYLIDRHGHASKWGLGAHQWAHVSSADLVAWTHHPLAIAITDQDQGSICTGSAFAHEGAVHGFYAVRTIDGSPARLAEVRSTDGIHFEKTAWSATLTALEGTRQPVKLPAFAGKKFPRVLRVLHQELLVNVTPAGPVPNFFVYPKPWYRDGAMMALTFQETGNLDTIRDWIANLREPYDRNNAGETEADNLGEALFLISLAGDKTHPLVAKILAERPAYQTKWLKYGLRALGFPDPYSVPPIKDSYSALFWMDYKDSYQPGSDADDRGAYPYLGWACDHFHGTRKSPIGNRDYPLTWEQNASQANYDGLKLLDPIYVQQKLSAPHTWHAAEVFLYTLSIEAD